MITVRRVLIVGCRRSVSAAWSSWYLSVSTTRSLGLPNSTLLAHPLWPLARPSVTSLTLWLLKVLFVAVQV
jgi:hypothetical protein